MNPAEALRQKLDALPARPGVYLMKDTAGRVIYVGKAKSLRSRVRSYFQRPEEKDPKTRVLVRHIADFDFLVLDSEKEALIAENNLIKKHRPRYNIRLRDDKNYLCVKLTVQEEFPRIYLVRGIGQDGARYFGPYHSSTYLRETLALLNRHFPLRKCTDAQFATRTRPCLMHQIGRCHAPCVGLIGREDYRRIVEEVLLFLEGRSDELVRLLTERMHGAAEALEFERAARLRDQIGAIQKTLERQKAVSPDLADRDVIGLYREGTRAQVAVLFVRQGKMIGGRSFALSQIEIPDDEIVASFVGQFYGGEGMVPEEILLPADFEDRAGVESALRELRGRAVRLLVPRRGDRARLLAMARKNAEAQFRARRDRGEDAALALAQLQQSLRLFEPPVTIDCFDISNLGGTLTVGSKVRFREGEPDKAGYRRFRVRAAAASDDYASLAEVLGRWIDQARREGEFPSLVLVDGGKGQLAMVQRVFAEKEYLQSALAAIAKPQEGEATDKIYLPGRKNPVVFPRGSSALFLLQRVRDEAHRFAVEYNRKLHGRSHLRSALDEVPGVGPRRRAALISAFGSLQRLREATVDQIAAVPGIPAEIAARVHAFLRARGEKDGAPAGEPT